MFKNYIIELNKTINLGAKNGPVGWNVLINCTYNILVHHK